MVSTNEMWEPTTLIIKHIPATLTEAEQEELFMLFGAKRVRCMPKKGKLKCIAFITFNDHNEAKQALLKLHQLEVLDQRLIAEFAKKENKYDFPKESDFPLFQLKDGEDVKIPRTTEKEQLQLFTDDFSKKLHGICPLVGLDYLPSPLLKYKYPPPSPAIIANISHALVSVPKFYTQVLHLMNKMNLPAPFGPVTPSPPAYTDVITSAPVYDDAILNNKLHAQEMDTDTEESEMESDMDDAKNVNDIIPLKRVSKTVKKQKKPKLHQFIPSALPKSLEVRSEPADVFESHVQLENQKKIQFNIKPTLEASTSDPTPIDQNIGFGIIKVLKPDENKGEIITSRNDPMSGGYITLSELRHKRISVRERKTLSVFRNYSPGDPTVRLYIKNLARQVEEKDLRYIFGRFIDWDSETDSNMFDIRLMKEGRMKGQAFITLATENQAIEAVKETNGFLLHTKPLVVQFARSAKPKDNPDKKK